MVAHSIRTNILFPEDLLEEIKKIVGKGKRSSFVVEATKEKLERMKFLQALNRTKGSWSDKNHPTLKNQRGLNRYLKKIRSSANKRIEKLLNA
ncbi:MAG: hypothetical protein AB1393_00110 [Candidatus Edwardsbacteria bacterium]